MRFQTGRKRAARRRVAPQGPEILEARALLATVTVNASQVVRPVNTQLSGVNVAWWDTNLKTTQTKNMVLAASLTSFRFPGGSSSDTFHFNAGPTYSGEGTVASMAQFIASVNGQGIVTLDYGSGSPQEAAAELSYLDAPTSSNVQISYGEEWSTSSNSWVQVNWQNSGYWASLRAAKPITPDDGLNFLRIGRAAPFGFQYFEVGNEEYGSWETDHHGQGGDTGKPHDPVTYVKFAKSFAGFASRIDPSISIGYDVGDPYAYNNWAGNILRISASQGFSPGFLSDHLYVQAPGSESDSYLLQDTFSDPKSIDDWAVRGADYQRLLTQYYGSAGAKVQLLGTEFNSVYTNPGKQSTSLVNGLSVADTLGVLLNSPYDGANFWDLRNGWSTSGNNSSSLYGWRKGGDYGLIGSPNGSPPSSGTYVPYPTYFAEQLGSKIIRAGGKVVQASSNDTNLTAYAVLESNGHLDLLVINKSASSALTGNFDLTGFTPGTSAQVWQYGEAQDTAQSQTTDGHSALANFAVTLSVNGSTFSLSFPAYSMTVLDLTPPPSSGTASIIGTNTTAKGNWIGVFGSDGYNVINNAVSYPSDVTVTANGETASNFVTSTTDTRALENAPGTASGRTAGVWYAASSFTVNVDITDSTSYDLSLYLLDWSNIGRSEQVQITRASDGTVLSTQTVSSFSGGVYLKWAISGDVNITFTKLASANSVLTGLFFDPAGTIASPSRTAAASPMLVSSQAPSPVTAGRESGLAVANPGGSGNLVTPPGGPAMEAPPAPTVTISVSVHDGKAARRAAAEARAMKRAEIRLANRGHRLNIELQRALRHEHAAVRQGQLKA
jgi:hypothetical protein